MTRYLKPLENETPVFYMIEDEADSIEDGLLDIDLDTELNLVAYDLAELKINAINAQVDLFDYNEEE